MTIRDKAVMSLNRSATDILNSGRNRGGSSAGGLGPLGPMGRVIPDVVLRQFTREADRISGTINNLREVSRNLCESNVDEQIQAVRRVVNSFNDMLSAAKQKGGQNVTRLERELINLVRDNPNELRRMGITVNRDGSLRMNNTGVRAAAERGNISRIVNNTSNPSFINSLSATANAVSRNPGTFLAVVSHVRS